MTKVRIWTYGLAQMRAELIAPDKINDQRAFAVRAIDALFALGEGLFQPLSIEVELACCDFESGYPLDPPEQAAQFHQLRLASVPNTVDVEESWKDTVIAECEKLDRTTILAWFDTLLNEQACPRPDTNIGWLWLIVGAVRARLPEAIDGSVYFTSQGDILPVTYGSGVINYPVERSPDGLWVAGPLTTNSETSPFEVRILNEAGVLTLDLSRNWSPWIAPEGAGQPDIEAAIRRLTALGWTMVSNNSV